MAGAVLGLLEHVLELGPGRQGDLHPPGLVAHHQQLAGGIEALATGQYPFHQGGTGQGLEHLGQVAFHAGALPGSQYGNGEHRQGRDHWAGIYRPSPDLADVGGPSRGGHEPERRFAPSWIRPGAAPGRPRTRGRRRRRPRADAAGWGHGPPGPPPPGSWRRGGRFRYRLRPPAGERRLRS